ncbi:hypothetical protein EOA32_29505 [Mesorhizobium sp. M1A.F.Ca.ET.072.01.1.1]|uniref:hypothetical protein n=1 Tax=Mesorhizobium sp. M1A.F.Ca.ET.072.01.1.1 TaxID=2496753 RepID=UPI000FD1E3BC|nr:hypothetical protein [Mesorhizobium sp. M1A.F.Ca.ET.072.01.1.1]RUW47189.1 hypothetical protein EOA32_29505 [Mesorhizobium sp. M1A.F.Ca.ET.072.01.1.1]TIU65439.1 MAG: hypothetical protein E5W25_20625 [Mesorhizobium sp.]TIV04771.1 MAG: hypothetical protein E5W04_01925 [Mesorhizobium sp.]
MRPQVGERLGYWLVVIQLLKLERAIDGGTATFCAAQLARYTEDAYLNEATTRRFFGMVMRLAYPMPFQWSCR